jgi:hypothetical protein
VKDHEINTFSDRYCSYGYDLFIPDTPLHTDCREEEEAPTQACSAHEGYGSRQAIEDQAGAG